jgi:hypothetical protein
VVRRKVRGRTVRPQLGEGHIISGVKTNIITAVEIRGRAANDSPLFRPLVATTRQAFKIEEASAD